ncbi:hypothetical protein SEPCBS119000_001310 [Sporothrix epigloea]|uniref:Uncharacterized protein n=1 Tax=Sporothrix epigloea TaxID=1892477 RepID=A0ABP0DD01_9PEZI
MHYIRLLRPPSVCQLGQASSSLGLVLTITTDLGESFLAPDAPIDIAVELVVETIEDEVDEPRDGENDDEKPHTKKVVKTRVINLPLSASSTASTGKASRANRVQKSAAAVGSRAPSWRAGLRVLKVDAWLSKDAEYCVWGTPLRPTLTVMKRRICIRTADKKLSATRARQLFDSSSADSGHGDGSIMPLWLDVPDTADKEFPRVALRQLLLHDGVAASGAGACLATCVEVEEDIGESIARHVWDAGLMAVAFLADTCLEQLLSPRRLQEEDQDRQNAPSAEPSSLSESLHGILLSQQIQESGKPLRVLELGSGVGILGLGLAAIIQEARRRAFYLNQARDCNTMFVLTDLPDAEEHARANMARSSAVSLQYENLDWEDGRVGRFGPVVAGNNIGPESGNTWDLVVLSDCTYNVDMLPALVETLVALSSLNRAQDAQPLSVFLARKPRHVSEEALFSLMAAHGWTVAASKAVRLPVLHGDAEVVELFLYVKAQG